MKNFRIEKESQPHQKKKVTLLWFSLSLLKLGVKLGLLIMCFD